MEVGEKAVGRGGGGLELSRREWRMDVIETHSMCMRSSNNKSDSGVCSLGCLELYVSYDLKLLN